MARDLPTYGTIRDKVKRELALEDEEFITEDEILGYYNDAISECEAEIHTLYEDYFLSNANLSLVNGEDDIDIPSDIYGLKIRGIIYNNRADLIYPIKRIRELRKFSEIAVTQVFGQNNLYYRYILINRSASEGNKIKLVPASSEDSDTVVTIWYLRRAARALVDNDPCDIPEFLNFIYAFMRVACKMKENNGSCPPELIGALEKQRSLMKDTLQNKVVDEDNEVEQDFSHYEEQI